MSAPPRLRRLFSWALVGQGGYAASQWLLLVLIAKLLPTDVAAEVADTWIYALAVIAPCVLLSHADMRVLISAEVKPRYASATYLRARAWSLFAMSVVVALIASLVPMTTTQVATVFALLGARVVEGFLDWVYGHYQRSERQDWLAASQIARALLGAGLGSWALLRWQSAAPMAAALAVAWLVVLVGFDLPRVSKLRFEATRGSGSSNPAGTGGRTRKLLWAALPLGLTAALISLNTSVPRYAIEAWGPDGSLGTFGSVAFVLVALALVNQALRGSTLPRFAAAYAVGDTRAAGRVLAATLAVAALPGLLLALLAWGWGGEILTLLYNASYGDQGPLLAWLCLGAVMGGVAGSLRAALTALGVLRRQVGVTAAALAVTAAIAFLWVPRAPLLGAAMAVLAGRAVMVSIHGALLFSVWKRRPAVS